MHKNVRCPNVATASDFDCTAGVVNWKDWWSKTKKEWCCNYKNVACPWTTTSTTTVTSTITRTSTATTSTATTSSETSTSVTSTSKTITSTSTRTTSTTLYDCQAALKNWQNEWAAKKKRWCCDNEALGCDSTTASTTSESYDSTTASTTSKAVHLPHETKFELRIGERTPGLPVGRPLRVVEGLLAVGFLGFATALFALLRRRHSGAAVAALRARLWSGATGDAGHVYAAVVGPEGAGPLSVPAL